MEKSQDVVSVRPTDSALFFHHGRVRPVDTSSASKNVWMPPDASHRNVSAPSGANVPACQPAKPLTCRATSCRASGGIAAPSESAGGW